MNNNTALHVSNILKALADPTRQRIMALLRARRELSVGGLTELLRVAQPTVSQHLRILRESGAVVARKEGQQVYYRLCSERIYDALKEFLGVFEQEVSGAKGKP